MYNKKFNRIMKIEEIFNLFAYFCQLSYKFMQNMLLL